MLYARKIAKQLLVLLCATMLVLGPAAIAAAYPDRPIKLIVPFAVGGNSHSIARTFAERMSVKLGQPIIIENKVGADTRIATEFVARSQPDGYTMTMTSVNFAAVNKALYQALPYDQETDFAAVIVDYEMLEVDPTMGAAGRNVRGHPGDGRANAR